MDLVCYRFGNFELQPVERRLLQAGAPLTVGPRAFRVLLVLIEHSGHLVTKDELLAAVWPRVVVEENALQAQISALRKILGARAITTVSRGGYRFELPVDRVTSASAAPMHNLPQQVTAFIGRDREIQEAAQLLETTHVLTLTGAGGCGKTRLALQVSTALLHAYPDGVWFVELAAVGDPRLVPHAVARTLEVREHHGRTLTQALCDHFASMRSVLLLDNAEHLLEACAALVAELIRACPHVRVLVTSRERLDIAGEVTYRVPSLAIPGTNNELVPDELLTNESVRLFVNRAQATRPHFRVTEDNTAPLASVCRRLDGIPLAIELAAPRLRAMSLEEMDRRLDRCLSLLTTSSRTALPRHRTLRALLDWSYELLSANEQALLQRVSCFAGGWTLDAAEDVCVGDGVEAPEILDLLTSLTDKSLVMADEMDGATRYTLLETVRQYASERADECDARPRWQARHFEFYFALAERCRESEGTADYAISLRVLDAEHDNLRAAMAWSAGTDPSQGLRLGAALWRFWWMRGYSGEGSKALLALLAVAPESLDPAIRLEALTRAAVLLTMVDDFPTARTLFESALTLGRAVGAPRPLANLMMGLANLHRRLGDPSEAGKCYEEAIELWRALGDRLGLGKALGNLAMVVEDPQTALRLHEESLGILRESGDHWGVATELSNVARILRRLGDRAAARKANEDALDIYREFGEVTGTAATLARLGALASDERDYESALLYLKQGMKRFAAVGDRVGIVAVLLEIGYLCAREEPMRAARIWGAAERLFKEIGLSIPIDDTEHIQRSQDTLRAAMADDEALDAAWRSGQGLGFEAAIDYALATTLPPSLAG